MKYSHALSSLLLVAGLMLSCKSTNKGADSDWSEVEVKAPSVEVLWQVTRLALQRENLPVQNRFDPATRTTTTGWEINLAPFKGQGYRERALVRYEALGAGEYQIEARVMRDTNEALARPLDITYAKWKSAADNAARARILLQRIRGYLGNEEFEVGEKPDPFR